MLPPYRDLADMAGGMGPSFLLQTLHHRVCLSDLYLDHPNMNKYGLILFLNSCFNLIVKHVSISSYCKHDLTFTLQVFEDALEALEEEEAVPINNNKPSKKSHSTFKLKRSKSKKEKSDSLEEDISLEQGLIEGQEAIDLFFDNKFAESREIAQKQ